MSQLSPVCLSLTPNLRCVGFTLGQFEALIIPPFIEVIISLFFIHMYSGPSRRAQILLVADSVLYFVWALLDMLSHIVPTAQNSSSVFKALDFLVGAASFTPILIYSIYLYRLSFRHFIPTLPYKLQPYLEISLPILSVIAVAINEVSSFVGTHLTPSSNRYPPVEFSLNSESLYLSLSRSSLTIYTITQFIFFLLAFSRLSKAFLDQRRIELSHSDEYHSFRGIAWITTGIVVGVIETIAGFTRVSFGVALARRILRLIARAILMYGSLKCLDIAENFEILTDESRGVSRISRYISRMLCINPHQTTMFRRISHSYSEQLQVDERAPTEKQSRERRVTVHCEKGQAPFLKIRSSTFDFPAHMIADMVQQRRRSLSGLIPGRAGTGSRTHGDNVSDKVTAARDTILDTPGAKSTLATDGSLHHISPEWIRPPERICTRRESGGADSDNLSIVRDLERRFPNLPPRVTGKYRGSILGQNYEEDPFPVHGVSRQSSLRRGDPSEEGGVSATLSTSGSIKRKPAPPLLENISYISDRRKHSTSTWEGFARTTVDTSAVPNSAWEGTTVHSPDSTLAREPSTPRQRRTTARDIINRASRVMSDASIRSAEWLASANTLRSARTPLTTTDIEMYRRGDIGPRSGVGEAPLSVESLLPKARRSADDTRAHSIPSRSRTITGIGIGKQTTLDTTTHAELESGRELSSSSHVSVRRQATVIPGQHDIGPGQTPFMND